MEIKPFAEFLFWFSIGLIIYVYIGYYGILELFSRFFLKNKVGQDKDFSYIPFVSVIVAAYNEETVIREKMKNLLELDYPKDKLEILIASDGSTDNTVQIAKEYETRGIKVLDFNQNRGRASIHNDAVKVAKGEILVFSDSETFFEPDFIRIVVGHLQNPDYGCGAGDYTFKPMGKTGETESLYWRMEKKLRLLEYKLGIAPFASGGCFVIRKAFWTPLEKHSDIDNFLPYHVVHMGYKVFYAEKAKACDVTISNTDALYRKRVRTVIRSLPGILIHLLPLIKKGRFAVVWVLISHRVLRWLGGFMMLAIFIANIWLLGYGQVAYGLSMLGQLVFYGLGYLGWLEEKGVIEKFSFPQNLHRTIHSFIVANVAFCAGIFQVVTGKQIKGYKSVTHA